MFNSNLESLVDLLLDGKFRSCFESTIDDPNLQAKLRRPAITYIDSDWNIRTILYENFVENCRYVLSRLSAATKCHSEFNVYLEKVSVDDNEEIQLRVPSSSLIIFGDCGQWTPILMTVSNLLKISFYFVDDERKLTDSLQFFSGLKNWLQLSICHQNRYDLLTQILTRHFPSAKFQIESLLEDYRLVTIKFKDQCLQPDDLQVETLNVSYIINTSGTTGLLQDSVPKSKLIFVPQESICDNIQDFKEEYQLNETDSVLVCSPFTFDPSICDTFLALSSFCHLFLISNSIRNSPSSLLRVLSQFRISYITITPSVWHRFSIVSLREYLQSEGFSLRFLNFGGELSIPVEEIKTILEWSKSPPKIYNLYGLSEMSVWASIYKFTTLPEISGGEESYFEKYLPILGRPVKNTLVYLDTDDQILIESTRRRCLINDGHWSFRAKLLTNDQGLCVKSQQSSRIYYLNRHCQSSSVKVNGIKCHLSHIELLILNRFKLRPSPGISITNCYAIPGDWHEWNNSVLDIVISCPPDVEQSRMKHELIQYLLVELKLPFAFRFHFIDSRLNILTSNGKLNYRKLVDCVDKLQAPEQLVSRDQVELWLAFLVESTLNIKDFDQRKTFKDYGLESMSALQITLEIEQKFRFNKFGQQMYYPKLFELVLRSSFGSLLDWLCETLFSRVNEFQPATFCNHEVMLCGNETITQSAEIVSRNSNLDRIYQASQCQSARIEQRWLCYLEECVDSSPAVIFRGSQTLVIAASHSGLIAAIELQSGEKIWTNQLANRIEASVVPSSDGTLVNVGDYSGIFYAVNVERGNILWQYATGDMIKCTASVVKNAAEELIICGSYDHHLYCWHQFTGQFKWKSNISGSAIFSTPVIWKADQWMVLSCTLDGTVASLQLDNGALQWKVSLSSCPIFSTPKIIDHQAVIGITDSQLYSISLKTGSLVWKCATNGSVFSSPIVVNSLATGVMAICGTHAPSIISVRVTTGEIVWMVKTDSPIYGNVLFIDTLGLLLAIDTKGQIYEVNVFTGEAHRCHPGLPGEVFSSPVVHGEDVLVGTRSNYLHCLRLTQQNTF